MKAKDLMIGDWVNYHDDDKIVPKQVSEITNYKQLQVNDKNNWIIVGEKYCEPIPLTAEILEKNGFIRDGESWWYQDFRIVLSTSKGVSLVCGRQKRFAFVHELQHALRFCGIEKEIEL